MIKTKWQFPLSLYEIVKLIVAALFSASIMVIAMKSRKISVKDYIESWRDIISNEESQG